ncbi:MAG TPA: winged helix DNA-binding domain-containing protein [Ktedonobacterales bacterium]|nr:winged helix DNA-binding domain-containing protein [Ktedonobacterales bacterium]
MNSFDIVHHRLLNQRIAGTPCNTPTKVVQWLGAVQAQDYPAAKWAVGLRALNTTENDVEQAITTGTILRTHVLRPTWHFVTPADIRWMLALTAPRVNAANAYYYRQQGLEDTVFRRSNTVLEKALQGGKQLTRVELVSALKQAGIVTENLGFLYLLIRAELDGLICSGAPRGKQSTYALLAERAPQAKILARDEALAELTRRYFTSHGPATIQDFVWWSGLTTADVKIGLEMIKSYLLHETIDGRIYWFAEQTPPAKGLAQTAYLLPNYDEYIVGYTDRSAIFDTTHISKLDTRGNPLFQHTMLLDGRIVGAWQRAFQKGAASITFSPFTALSENERQAFAVAADQYGQFLHIPVSMP